MYPDLNIYQGHKCQKKNTARSFMLALIKLLNIHVEGERVWTGFNRNRGEFRGQNLTSRPKPHNKCSSIFLGLPVILVLDEQRQVSTKNVCWCYDDSESSETLEYGKQNKAYPYCSLSKSSFAPKSNAHWLPLKFKGTDLLNIALKLYQQ